VSLPQDLPSEDPSQDQSLMDLINTNMTDFNFSQIPLDDCTLIIPL
jgi:hypothetical protein